MNFSFFADIFFPSVCLVCGAKTNTISCCALCRAKITINKDDNSGAPFHAAARYADPVVQKLVWELKFNMMKSSAVPLGDLIADHVVRCKTLSQALLPNAEIIPIPLSRKRERVRGFNQSALIAERFGKIIGLEIRTDVLVRIRHAKPQSETTTAAERKKNILGCFSTRRSPPKNIILLDDVVTTGSTFSEAAKVLSAAGASSIIAIAAARS